MIVVRPVAQVELDSLEITKQVFGPESELRADWEDIPCLEMEPLEIEGDSFEGEAGA